MNFTVALLCTISGLLFALFADVGSAFHIDWFLFGLYFRIDFIGKIFLIFSSLVWVMSALYSYGSITTHQKRYWFWFVVTFIGNYGLILSYDAIGFYLFFSLMSLAAFGLVVHSQTVQATHAAFVYIKYAMVGEVALFAAVLLSANHYGGVHFDLFTTAVHPVALWLFIIGFGIKSGVIVLHYWLPLAHGNAPAAASAVLSGVMLKAGILGLIRYLPFGQEMEVLGGIALCTLGVIGIYAGAYGIFKDKIKVVLAYSSIAQMGYIITLLGVGLLDPDLWDTIAAAIVFFSLHHAINKSALFLLSGEVMKNGLLIHYRILGSIFALSLIGVGYTSGSVAKQMLLAPLSESSLLFLLLGPSMIVTALLMLKIYWLSRKIPKKALLGRQALYILYPMAVMSLLLFAVV